MVVTDLDGTLYQKDRRASPRNLRTLQELGGAGVVRAVATGRNLYSARQALPPGFPVDYLLFSSGAGVMDWAEQRLLRSSSLSAAEAARVLAVLAGRGLDFMLHRPIPDNHFFWYYGSGRDNPDFEARKGIYARFCSPGDPSSRPAEACQFVVVEPPDRRPSCYEELRAEFAGLTVLRTTSPLDGRSRWIEIFPAHVSKSQAAAWLAAERGIDRERVLAVGNDYNDLDLLDWAACAYVVAGSPPELRSRFPTAASGDESDFAEAVALWRRSRPPGGPT